MMNKLPNCDEQIAQLRKLHVTFDLMVILILF